MNGLGARCLSDQRLHQNGVDDTIDIAEGFPDCNENGIIDICDVSSGSFEDCNDNSSLMSGTIRL